jgi:Tol biopolymer transport system component
VLALILVGVFLGAGAATSIGNADVRIAIPNLAALFSSGPLIPTNQPTGSGTPRKSPAASNGPSRDGPTNPPPTSPPLSGRVVFANDKSGGFLLYVMAFPSKDVRRLAVQNYDIANVRYPAWSHDGSQIAYSVLQDDLPSYVVVADADGTVQGDLKSDHQFVSLAWLESKAQDSKSLVAAGNETGNLDLYLIDASTRALATKPFLQDPATDTNPAPASDGSIVFSSDRSGRFQLYEATAAGAVLPLASSRGNDIQPSFSPDCSKLAFTSDRDGNREIYIADPDGKNGTRLTRHAGADEDPVWSPDGRYLLFVSDRSGTKDLYAIRPNKSGLTRVLKDPGDDRYPHWADPALPPRECG